MNLPVEAIKTSLKNTRKLFLHHNNLELTNKELIMELYGLKEYHADTLCSKHKIEAKAYTIDDELENEKHKGFSEGMTYYFTKDKHALKTMKHNKVKLSLLDKVNDLHEGVGVSFEDYHSSKGVIVNHEQIVEKVMHLKQAFTDNHGFVCFSKYYDNPLMWGHYANEGKGLCLGFENSMKTADLDPVSYSNSLKKKKIPIEVMYSTI